MNPLMIIRNKLRYLNATNIFRRIFGTITICPYKDHGIWMFSDDATGLYEEPFIEGIPEIIEFAIEKAGIKFAEEGFKLTFSKWPYPGYQGILRLAEDRKPGEGQWYTFSYDDKTMWGWLCPAMYCYF